MRKIHSSLPKNSDRLTAFDKSERQQSGKNSMFALGLDSTIRNNLICSKKSKVNRSNSTVALKKHIISLRSKKASGKNLGNDPFVITVVLFSY